MARHYYIAEPLPDELIGSVLIRTARHCGLGIKDFTESLTHSRQSRIPLLLSKHLKQVALATRASPLELLHQHTPFRYITAFMSANETNQLADCILSGDQRSLASLVQSVTIGARQPRFCQECIKEDRASFGESYWHRKHNIPFIDRCHRHETALLEFPSNFGFVATNLPEDCSGMRVELAPSTPIWTWLAEQSIATLETEFRRSVNEWFGLYRALAIQRGFPQQAGGLCGKSLCAGLQNLFSYEFFLKTDWQFKIDGTSWPSLMFRESHSTSIVSGKHLVIQAFLKFAPVPAKELRGKPGKKLRNYERLDNQFFQMLLRRMSQEQIQGRPAAKLLMKDLGIWETYRHERKQLVRTKTLVAIWYTPFRSQKKSISNTV